MLDAAFLAREKAKADAEYYAAHKYATSNKVTALMPFPRNCFWCAFHFLGTSVFDVRKGEWPNPSSTNYIADILIPIVREGTLSVKSKDQQMHEHRSDAIKPFICPVRRGSE